MKTEDCAPSHLGVSAENYRHAISRLPTGVTVITTVGPVGCTANAVMSLSLDPPSVLLSLTTASRTLAHIRAHGRFAVNVLPWTDRRLVAQFATGTPAERFADVPWHGVGGVPVLTQASVSVVCAVRETVSLLDHTLIAGTAEWTQVNDTPATVLYGNEQYAVGL
ncbi:NADH-FMN oxidoreductase RutF, flavin reductase (DIM6/NTAB) family [Streptomyces sp. 3213]|uniref:flavin reductase family protein n=1 Tax=Streptomyces sp. 3213.3 TaxID=1855348 RepID=UPI00089D0763|nr:flavin reductase family protein [Streptomyces sp. 3213.3]SEC38713.1 NADH-FMN oxidoreductase RutF, flavin reductase (DIM6/NTAB) family [Streptomyces sp. 3213] [Streptomyces sp. 3213.3]